MRHLNAKKCGCEEEESEESGNFSRDEREIMQSQRHGQLFNSSKPHQILFTVSLPLLLLLNYIIIL